MQVKPDSKPHEMLPQHIAYALQKLFKEELERLKQQMVEWWNSFVLVRMPNGKVRLCPNPARLNQVLIGPVHIGPTLNDIFPKLNNVKYLSIIDVSCGYHNLNLDERSSFLATFACQFGRYRYKRLPFGAAPQETCFSAR